jgi:cytochrome c biogenesis protein CcdA
MDFGPGTFALGYLAGLLSTLSPCVLPLLPILIATALGQHRFGPWALAAGLTVSFMLVGTVIAAFGASVGLDPAVLRQVAAGLLVAFGLVLLVPALQMRFAAASAGLAASGDGLMARVSGRGWGGQFAVGLVLGLVWSPCVGPTLGAASTLASQGRDLGSIALLMLLFGLGAATPLLLIGTLSREALARARGAAEARRARQDGARHRAGGGRRRDPRRRRQAHRDLGRRAFARLAHRTDDAVLTRRFSASCRPAGCRARRG